MVEYLITHGADVNKEDAFGRTPLDSSERTLPYSISHYLADHGGIFAKHSVEDESEVAFPGE